MLRLPNLLLDALEPLEERDANADEHLLLGLLDCLGVSLLLEACMEQNLYTQIPQQAVATQKRVQCF